MKFGNPDKKAPAAVLHAVLPCSGAGLLLLGQIAYTFPQCIQGRLRAVGKMEFIQDAADVFRNGPLIDDQFRRDFLVAQAACDQADRLQFAPGLRVRRDF
jgi:hypothetical protein